MKIVIFTYDKAPQERVDNIKVIQKKLQGMVTIHTGSTTACDNFLDILNKYSNDDLLLLEDDIELCDNFIEEVFSVIEKHKDEVINFHYNHGHGSEEVPSGAFMYNQCVYYPKRVLKALLKPSKEFKKKYPFFYYNNYWDNMIRVGLLEIREDHFIAHEPKLVKHLEYKSTIGDYTVTTTNYIGNK